MAYRLKTFRVQFVAESAGYPTGSPCRASEDVDRIARSIYGTLDANKEHFLLLTLNNKNHVNGFKVVSTGSLTASMVHPRAALHLCAAAVIFVHNHPSGEPAPSQEDQEITRRLKETGDMLGIRVSDHVVLATMTASSRSATGVYSSPLSRLTFALHCEGLGKLAALTLPCRVLSCRVLSLTPRQSC
jgi:proteasome lid subunit RPN8/RPN11